MLLIYTVYVCIHRIGVTPGFTAMITSMSGVILVDHVELCMLVEITKIISDMFGLLLKTEPRMLVLAFVNFLPSTMFCTAPLNKANKFSLIFIFSTKCYQCHSHPDTSP